MNEIPVGQRWPPFEERAARVEESIKIIRSLWENEFVTIKGKYFSVKDARIYERPTKRIPIYLAASGPRMAEMAGRLADGLYTVPTQEQTVHEILFPALKRGATEASRDFDAITKLSFCNIVWDEDYDNAREAIRRWRATAYPGIFGRHEWDPRRLDELGEKVSMEDLAWRWVICTDLDDAIKGVEKCVGLGFDEIEIRSCSPNEDEFIRKFGREALPYLREKYRD
jgi:coenzyme F420-dependent glucose-6-phosphate dehydrogenase